MASGTDGPGPQGKVARLLAKYEIEEYGDTLVDRWTTRDPDERLSLRQLARDLNVTLLATELRETGDDPIAGEAENLYDQLTGDGGSRGERTRAERRLEKRGVDVETLRDDFVSRQAIHTYLTGTRDVSQPETTTGDPVSTFATTIEKLRQRTRQVATSKLERLRDGNDVTLGSFRVVVDVQVYCEDCGRQFSVTDLLDAGGCDCVE